VAVSPGSTVTAPARTSRSLEATGIASGAYVYGDFPLKILGVPLCIPIMWVLVMALAYVVNEKYGPVAGILTAYSLDLILEPAAYFTGI